MLMSFVLLLDYGTKNGIQKQEPSEIPIPVIKKPVQMQLKSNMLKLENFEKAKEQKKFRITSKFLR